jgi:hypothetical protein
MKCFVLNPDRKDRLKNILGNAPTLSKALAKYVSTWSTIMDFGFDRKYFSISGNKRIRKKKLKRLLKRTFIEEFLDCMDEVELSETDASQLCNDLSLL